MRYTIFQSRGLFIIYENNDIKGYYFSYKEAEAQIRKLEYIDMICLMMSDY
jgi:hypothetical protein